MKILVSGTHGLVGSSLVRSLTEGGHEVRRLVRHDPEGLDEVGWDPAAGVFDLDGVEGVDAVVHLASANIHHRRWTGRRKRLIRNSRVIGTRHVAEAIATVRERPSVLVCASDVHLYGDRGPSDELREDAGTGEGFLAQVCEEWEQATAAAEDAGVRVVHLRFGTVLSPHGGTLGQMLPTFRLGLGGRLGDGTQLKSWVSLEDAVGAIEFAIARRSLSGPVNVTAPEPATNAELTSLVGSLLGRPTKLTMPAWLAHLSLGEVAREVLLSSQRVVPAALHEASFPFLDTDLGSMLRATLVEGAARRDERKLLPA